MPVQKAKSSLISKLGNRLQQAHEAHKADETVMSNFGDLPAGIDQGVAQLVECKFDVYKSGDFVGEYYFYAAGVVLYPDEVEGFPVKGLRTSIGPEPMCDTPKRESKPTLDHHIEWIYNQLRLLGIDTSALEFEDLETTAAALKEAQPTFRFRTWKGQVSKQYPNPKTNHTWNGLCDWVEQDTNPVEDNTPTTQAAPKTPNGAATRTPAKPTGKKGKEVEVQQEFSEFEDLDSLAEQAEEGNTDARKKLNQAGLDAGISQEDIDAAPDWATLVNLIQGGGLDPVEDNGDEPDADAEEFEPEVGGVFGYSYKDPKTKKVVTVQCEVLKVNKKVQTVDLLNLDNRKNKYPGVAWDDLIREE